MDLTFNVQPPKLSNLQLPSDEHVMVLFKYI